MEYVDSVDVVFTGTVEANEGDETQPKWRFEVEGVVKGEVEPVQIVTGQGWRLMCGTNFARFGGDVIVVFADRKNGGLDAVGCVQTPTAAEFARLPDSPTINPLVATNTESTPPEAQETESPENDPSEAASGPESGDSEPANRWWPIVALGGLASFVAAALLRRRVS